MIIIRFSGGLGNQIYQYAMLKKLQLKYLDAPIKIDLSFYRQNNVHNGFEMEKVFGIFGKGIHEAKNKELLKVKYEVPFEAMENFPEKWIKPVAWLNARSRWIFTKTGFRNEIKEEIQNRTGGFVKQDADKLIGELDHINSKKDYYIDGYWQNELFFREILSKVLEELRFPNFKDIINIELEGRIKERPSAGIHVRRGDYVNGMYDILTQKYYKNAIRYIESRRDVYDYYIFTDDIQYVEQEFSFLKNKYIVRHNTGENSWCDMKLMSLCKYNILANSSFSNWAGYFNRNEDKIIVYPSQYMKGEKNTDKFERGWVKLEVG